MPDLCMLWPRVRLPEKRCPNHTSLARLEPRRHATGAQFRAVFRGKPSGSLRGTAGSPWAERPPHVPVKIPLACVYAPASREFSAENYLRRRGLGGPAPRHPRQIGASDYRHFTPRHDLLLQAAVRTGQMHAGDCKPRAMRENTGPRSARGCGRRRGLEGSDEPRSSE